ncbi:MAG: LacI family DNA-binding transcriptional regulator [Oscillospiraceae bacterium]|nr:LacI family DNA-binding transcriptional regulator [Oscillospiraceae bacterium]
MKRNENRKIIGLILENIFTDFSKELIQSVADAMPSPKNFRLVVLAGKYDGAEIHTDAKHHNYLTVYNSIFHLDSLCHFDGLIIHLGSMTPEKKRRIRTSHLDYVRNIPRVFIASDMEGETLVNYDNEAGIREAVNYLVNINEFSHFCMLGGRDDNIDAIARKNIFIRCLKEKHISFSEQNYQRTDMSDQCEAEAEKLLENNPDVQAVFCVNDSVAKALYSVMNKKNLVPGRDILVFGFDNTHLAGELIPSLSSIGADNCALGKKALEMLLRKMNGEEVRSALVPTRLYGRESFHYEMYDYTELEMIDVNPAFIHRMFDDCFYRYRNSYIDRESVNLKRLFYEFISRMLFAMKRRYMSIENFGEIQRMIDKFFEKGAMDYTDAAKLLNSVERLQSSINVHQKSIAANVLINRLFLRIKDRAICALAEQRALEKSLHQKSIRNVQEFMLELMPNAGTEEENLEHLLRNIDKLGLQNSAVYLFEKPVRFRPDNTEIFPETIRLHCVMKAGEIYVMPKERRTCSISEIFSRNELSLKCKGYVAFTLFYGYSIYGILLCELADTVYRSGDYIALQLSKAIYLNRLQALVPEENS